MVLSFSSRRIDLRVTIASGRSASLWTSARALASTRHTLLNDGVGTLTQLVVLDRFDEGLQGLLNLDEGALRCWPRCGNFLGAPQVGSKQNSETLHTGLISNSTSIRVSGFSDKNTSL